MHIVIAPDSFKGSLSAKEAAQLMEMACKKELPEATIDAIPMADGGEGTVDAFIYATNGKRKTVNVTGPLGSKLDTYYGILGNNETAVIEMAAIAGLTLVPEKKNPLHATTYGVGECILDALSNGFKHLIVGIGGSATNDGGIGMLQALGVTFYTSNGEVIPPYAAASALEHVHDVDFSNLDSRLKDATIQVACDVDNPLCGPKGASYIFGPQKGATPEQISYLDKCLHSYASCIEANLNVSLQTRAGSGAAGGIGFALLAIGAELLSGAELVANATNLEDRLKKANWLITGEGKSDEQTLHGKVPFYLATLAKKHDVPTILLSGSIADTEEFYDHFASAHSIMSEPVTLEYAIQHAEQLLTQKARNIVRLLKY